MRMAGEAAGQLSVEMPPPAYICKWGGLRNVGFKNESCLACRYIDRSYGVARAFRDLQS